MRIFAWGTLGLAQPQLVCLIASRQVQLEQKAGGARLLARSAMAGLLGLFLLLASAASVNHALHQALHQTGSADTHVCLLCSLAKGQVTPTEALSLGAMILVCGLILVQFPEGLPQSVAVYSLSRSRAPPTR
jgi:hypothetical protein